MTDFTAIKEAFTKAGWALDHVSKDEDGTERSVYFVRTVSFAPRYVTEKIRIADHHLGTTVYGEDQGRNLDANFVLEDYPDDTTPEEWVIMCEDDHTREVAAGGLTPTTDGWDEEVAEQRERFA